MSVIGQMIAMPVGIDDVRTVLGVGSAQLGDLCTSFRVNKWSVYKPIRHAGVTSPTDSQIIASHCGIRFVPAADDNLFEALRSSGNTQPLPENIHFSTYEWDAPTGGAASPYRLSDFAAPNEASSQNLIVRNYVHNSPAPDTWFDWEIEMSTLTNFNSYAYQGLSLNNEIKGSGATWYLDTQKSYLCSTCAIRFGTSSGDTIGGTSSYTMPLTYLFGNMLDSNTEVWRLGLAVYLPYGLEGNGSPSWRLFVGSKGLSRANGGAILPNLATNLMAVQGMYNNVVGSHKVKEFPTIPVFVKNCTITGEGVNGGQYLKTYVGFLPSSQVLTSTSEAAITIKVRTPEEASVKDIVSANYRGQYYTPIVANSTYYISATHAVVTSSSTTITHKYHKVVVPSGCSASLTSSDSTSNGVAVTYGGGTTTLCSVTEYDTVEDMRGERNGTTSQVPFSDAVNNYFVSFVGRTAPSSVSATLVVSRNRLL